MNSQKKFNQILISGAVLLSVWILSPVEGITEAAAQTKEIDFIMVEEPSYSSYDQLDERANETFNCTMTTSPTTLDFDDLSELVFSMRTFDDQYLSVQKGQGPQWTGVWGPAD